MRNRKTNLSRTINPSPANSLAGLTTTYAGEFAGEYIAAALLSGVTLDKGGVTVKPNIKYREVIKKITDTDFIAAAGCDFTPTEDAITVN